RELAGALRLPRRDVRDLPGPGGDRRRRGARTSEHVGGRAPRHHRSRRAEGPAGLPGRADDGRARDTRRVIAPRASPTMLETEAPAVGPLSDEASAGLDLRSFWYVAMDSAALVPGRVLGRVVLEEPLACFRDVDGRPVALEDRCRHRAAPL